MRGARAATCLWPGLPHLWWRGAGSGFALACGFACLLNFAVIGSYIWTEWAPPSLRAFAWLATGSLWVVGVVSNIGWSRRHPEERRIGAAGDLFIQASSEYLLGNWIAVERLCGRLLENDPRDAEARLLLATMCRRTGRFAEARRGLDLLDGFDSAAKWRFEIALERRRVDESESEAKAESNEPANSPSEKYETTNVEAEPSEETAPKNGEFGDETKPSPVEQPRSVMDSMGGENRTRKAA